MRSQIHTALIAIPGLAVLLVIFGCDKESPGPPPPPAKLTSPRIAFSSDRTGTSGIHLYDPASGQTTSLSPLGSNDRDPALSPDGMRIAFVSMTSTGVRLMTMAVDGRDRQICGNQTQSASGPRWSPDSRWIAFTGISASGARNAYAIRSTGDSLVPLTYDNKSTTLAWSPDGTRILYVHHEVLNDSTRDYLLDVQPNGSSARALLGPLEYAIGGADYSPDGMNIAFCYEGVPDIGYTIEICNSDGSGRNIIAEANPPLEGLSPPSWSPNGALIVFSAHITIGSEDLYTTVSTFSDPQILVGGLPNDVSPHWGPRP